MEQAAQPAQPAAQQPVQQAPQAAQPAQQPPQQPAASPAMATANAVQAISPPMQQTVASYVDYALRISAILSPELATHYRETAKYVQEHPEQVMEVARQFRDAIAKTAEVLHKHTYHFDRALVTLDNVLKRVPK